MTCDYEISQCIYVHNKIKLEGTYEKTVKRHDFKFKSPTFFSNKQASKQRNNKTQFMTSDEGVKARNKL